MAATLAVVLAGVAVLRAPPLRIGSRAVRVGEAREESAYAIGATPVSFPLPAGARILRLLLNFDLPESPAEAPAPLQVRVRLSPDGRDQTFSMLPKEAEGGRAFYLDAVARPSRTVLLGIERARDVSGTLEISIVTPWHARGVVRLLDLERRALETGEPAWANVPAAGAPRRRVYFDRGDAPAANTPSPAATAGDPGAGSWLEPGRGTAWTLEGPAKVTLSAQEGELRGVMRLLSRDGRPAESAVTLSAGRNQSISLAAGLTTVHLASSARARVMLTGPHTAAGPFAGAVALADGRIELRARPTIVEAARCGPPSHGTPVTWALAGRGEHPLKLDARPVVTDLREAASLRWRALDDRRRVLAQGTVSAAVRVADEDRILGSDARLSEPTTFYVWPTPRATALEVTCDVIVDLSAASPAWLDARDADGENDQADREALGFAENVRLRHGTPPVRRRYFGVAPANRGALIEGARVDRLALAPRLEVAPPPVSIAARSLIPVGRPPRVEMLVPDTATKRVETQVWSIPVGRETAFTSGGGSVNVVYEGHPSDASGSIRVLLDGRAVAEGPLHTARGQLTFATPPGVRKLSVDAPRSVRAFVNKPLSGTRMFRRVALYSVAQGSPVHLHVAKSTARHVVGLVFYGRGVVGEAGSVAVDIDRGKSARGGLSSRDRTALHRRAILVTSSLSTAVLLNTDVGPTWVSQPIFVTLGDDLRLGAHEIMMRVEWVTGPVFVRAFGHEQDASEGEANPLAWDLGT